MRQTEHNRFAFFFSLYISVLIVLSSRIKYWSAFCDNTFCQFARADCGRLLDHNLVIIPFLLDILRMALGHTLIMPICLGNLVAHLLISLAQ